MPPNVKTEQPLLPSLLDRLIDDDPDLPEEPLWKGAYRLEDLREDVRRDLQFLLNARHGRFDLLKYGGQLAKSTLTFGLPDFTGSIGGEKESRERVRGIVERAIRDFEPRLTNVQVIAVDEAASVDRNIQLTIQAVLFVDPIVEMVAFDTIVESTTGICDVRMS